MDEPIESVTARSSFWKSPSLRITTSYLVIGVLWILLTDLLVAHFITDVSALTYAQMLKGWFYVAGTGVLLWLIVRHYVSRLTVSARTIAQHSKQLERSNRALLALSGCNQLLARIHDEGDLLRELCHWVVDVCGYRLAWVGYADQDAAKTVRPVAHAGLDDGYLETLQLTWADVERGRGPTGTAIRTGKARSVRDMLNDPTYAPWREQAVKRRYASSIALPLKGEERVFGALNIYATAPDAFDHEEVRLLQEMAADLAYGILSLRARAQRDSARASLAASEERFDVLFDAVRDGILLADVEKQTFLAANAAICSMLGYDRDELLTLHMRDLHPPEQFARVLAMFETQVRGDTKLALEVPLKRKDGSVFYADVNASVVHWHGHSCLLGAFRDVTERREAERQLRETEEQLRQAQKLEAIGQLAGGIAHDFNNMLSAILGHAELILRDVPDDSVTHRDAASIQACAERAAELTRKLLAFSRKQRLVIRVINLNEVIAGIEDMLRPLIGDGVKLSVVLADDLGAVRADAGQIEQALMNLVVNARDAMPAGGRLSIVTSNLDVDADFAAAHDGLSAGPHVRVTVADTGTGMDPETCRRAFDPFFTTKDVHKGTGLGLSTVYGIVRQSGGAVTVDSAPGRGTTFAMIFPRVYEAVEPPAAAPSPDVVARGAETVLVVEDDLGVGQLVGRMLETGGYRALVVGGVEDALDVCRQHDGKIDLVITDVIMPRLSGKDLADRLAAAWPGIKVLYTSGYTGAEVLNHGVRAPATAFIDKPFTLNDLLSRVREALDA